MEVKGLTESEVGGGGGGGVGWHRLVQTKKFCVFQIKVWTPYLEFISLPLKMMKLTLNAHKHTTVGTYSSSFDNLWVSHKTPLNLKHLLKALLLNNNNDSIYFVLYIAYFTNLNNCSHNKLNYIMHFDWFLFIILWTVDRCMNDFTINSILPFFIKQIHSMLSWVSSVKDHRCQSVVRKSVKHSALFVAWKKSCYL